MDSAKLFISNTDPQSKEAIKFLYLNKIPTEVYEWHNSEDLEEFTKLGIWTVPTLLANNEWYEGLTQIQLAFE